jgi:hypothetical protein
MHCLDHMYYSMKLVLQDAYDQSNSTLVPPDTFTCPQMPSGALGQNRVFMTPLHAAYSAMQHCKVLCNSDAVAAVSETQPLAELPRIPFTCKLALRP